MIEQTVRYSLRSTRFSKSSSTLRSAISTSTSLGTRGRPLPSPTRPSRNQSLLSSVSPPPSLSLFFFETTTTTDNERYRYPVGIGGIDQSSLHRHQEAKILPREIPPLHRSAIPRRPPLRNAHHLRRSRRECTSPSPLPLPSRTDENGSIGRSIDYGCIASDGAAVGLFPHHVLWGTLRVQEEESVIREDCCAGFYWGE